MDNNENGMTDYQFKVFLKLLLGVIESSNDIEETKAYIRNLIDYE